LAHALAQAVNHPLVIEEAWV